MDIGNNGLGHTDAQLSSAQSQNLFECDPGEWIVLWCGNVIVTYSWASLLTPVTSPDDISHGSGKFLRNFASVLYCPIGQAAVYVITIG